MPRACACVRASAHYARDTQARHQQQKLRVRSSPAVIHAHAKPPDTNTIISFLARRERFRRLRDLCRATLGGAP